MKERKGLGELELDRIVHERARLMILTHLASSAVAEIGFTEIKSSLGLSSGNLSVQLKTLEEAGYVGIVKSFRDKKPWTGITLTTAGKMAIEAYLRDLDVIVASLRGRDPAPQRGGKE
jgi:DNA-binding HxlR family transcriptional regulator